MRPSVQRSKVGGVQDPTACLPFLGQGEGRFLFPCTLATARALRKGHVKSQLLPWAPQRGLSWTDRGLPSESEGTTC